MMNFLDDYVENGKYFASRNFLSESSFPARAALDSTKKKKPKNPIIYEIRLKATKKNHNPKPFPDL